jgi:hypothetical protein
VKLAQTSICKSFLFIFLAGSGHAFADSGSVCDPVESIRSKVNYCHENFAYTAPAQACLAKYRAEVAKKNAEITKLLGFDLAHADEKAQNGTFHASESVLSSADKTLLDLIAEGEDAYSDIEDYAYDMVMPIYLPEDMSLDPEDPETQKGMREDTCYGQPMDSLDAVKKDIDSILDGLRTTEKKVSSLSKATHKDDSSLSSINGQNAVTGKAGAEKSGQVLKKGQKPPTQNDVTGVEEDKAREDKANKKLQGN